MVHSMASGPSMMAFVVLVALVRNVYSGDTAIPEIVEFGKDVHSVVLLQQSTQALQAGKQIKPEATLDASVQTVHASQALHAERAHGDVGKKQHWSDFVNASHNAASDDKKATSAHMANRVAMPSNSKLVGAYCAALIVMALICAVMFYPMGAAVVFQVVLYVGCLAFIKIAMKIVFEYGYAYPKFVTSLHLLVSSLAAFIVMAYRRLVNGKEIAVPTVDELLYGIIPIAFTFGLSIGSENSALVFVSAAFSEVVACSNPVMSAFLTWAFGMGFDLPLLMPIAVVVVGCLISISGEVYFSSVGLAMLLMAVFFRGLKAVMQQKLLTGETKDKFDPVTLMAWSCLLSYFELAAYSASTEGKAPFVTLLEAEDLTGLMVALLGSCAIACMLNISALFVIKQIGAVGMQMVSQMKALLVVIGGVAILDESFTNMQKIGFATVLAGVYWFSHMKTKLNPNAKGH